MKIITIIAILILIYSCSDKDNRFYDNNTDGKYRKYYSRDSEKGIDYLFDSLNENITSIIIWDNRLKKRTLIDMKEGSLIRIVNEQHDDSTSWISFNDKLNIRDISFSNQNSIKRYLFDKSSLNEIRDLIRINGNDYTVNEWRIFDTRMHVDDKRSFYIDDDLPDTIRQGKTTFVNLNFRSSGRFKLGSFINNSTNKLDTIKALHNHIQLDLRPSNPGSFTFKGIAILYDTLENMDVDEMKILLNRTYFVKE